MDPARSDTLVRRRKCIRKAFAGLMLATTLVLVACDERPTGGSSTQPGPLSSGNESIDGGPVAWWTFDEGDGTTAIDSSGKGNTASILNGGWADGRTGHALQMDGGNNSIVTVPLSDSLRSTADSITVMAWAYRTAEHNVDLVGHGYPYLFLGFHGPRFKWQIATTQGKTAACYADPEYRAALNQWFHLTGTYDGRTVRLYVDGVQICKKWLWRRSPIVMPETPFTLSGYLDNANEIVDEITGKIDDVRIYNRALSAGEIRDIYDLSK